MATKDPLNALIFWEQFFILYFRTNRSQPGFMPTAAREELNKHFIATAQKHANAEKQLHNVYYSFTRWSEDVVPYDLIALSPCTKLA